MKLTDERLAEWVREAYDPDYSEAWCKGWCTEMARELLAARKALREIQSHSDATAEIERIAREVHESYGGESG